MCLHAPVDLIYSHAMHLQSRKIATVMTGFHPLESLCSPGQTLYNVAQTSFFLFPTQDALRSDVQRNAEDLQTIAVTTLRLFVIVWIH